MICLSLHRSWFFLPFNHLTPRLKLYSSFPSALVSHSWVTTNVVVFKSTHLFSYRSASQKSTVSFTGLTQVLTGGSGAISLSWSFSGSRAAFLATLSYIRKASSIVLFFQLSRCLLLCQNSLCLLILKTLVVPFGANLDNTGYTPHVKIFSLIQSVSFWYIK